MKTVTLKGNPIDVVGTAPAVGSPAPSLMGVNADLKTLSLNDFSGKRKIVCFVPSLDTATCSTSAHKFNKRVEDLPNLALIYCSMDLPFALQRICTADKEQYKNVTALSLFRNPEVAKQFGAFVEGGPIGGLCARAVFVLDENNHVLYHQLVGEITHEPDYDKALLAVQKGL